MTLSVTFTAKYPVGFSGKLDSSWEQKSRSDRWLVGTIPMDRCGAHSLDLAYHQVGPYHDEDSAIDVVRHVDDFVIPCSFA